MSRIHWLGAGLSSLPGLRQLIAGDSHVVVWDQTIAKAQEALGYRHSDMRVFSLGALTQAVSAGDIVVSMLPNEWHVSVAKRCLGVGAHFLSCSYISPEMRALDDAFTKAGLVSMNEIGLDPGIDHLMAHWLVADYQASPAFAARNDISFLSYCGGVPKFENDFRYKFSWSPLGAFKALCAPSRSIRAYDEWRVERPWEAVSNYIAPLPIPETFEVYPNRDSLPFMAAYKFDPSWRVKNFARGTLRLNGWAAAWRDIFHDIGSLVETGDEARLKDLSDVCWQKYGYEDGEPDRVVLCVGLTAVNNNQVVYDKAFTLDAWGDERGSAMSRLVSGTVTIGVEAVLKGEVKPGVSAAPSKLPVVVSWIDMVTDWAQHLAVVDLLTGDSSTCFGRT